MKDILCSQEGASIKGRQIPIQFTQSTLHKRQNAKNDLVCFYHSFPRFCCGIKDGLTSHCASFDFLSLSGGTVLASSPKFLCFIDG